jgi:DNA-directed RNA polymerase subunit H (RpoH/RPB5)
MPGVDLPEEELRQARRGAALGAANVLRDHSPLPDRGLGEDVVRRAVGLDDDDDDRRVMSFPLHMRKLFRSIDEGEAEKLLALLALRKDTIDWIAEKNPRELKNLDGVVEFVSSSRTAAKVLMWVGGFAVAFVGGVTALAKNGIDLFAIMRGGR